MVKKNKGYTILGIILVVTVISVSVSAWALTGKSESTVSGGQSSQIKASSLINDGLNIKAQYDKLILQGTSPSSIVFIPNVSSTPTAQNILDPVNGIKVPIESTEIMRSGYATSEGIWVYNPSGFFGTDIGLVQRDSVLIFAGIKDSVCQQINKNLHNDPLIPYAGVSPSMPNSSYTVSGATSAVPMSTQTFTYPGNNMASGWMQGCVGVTKAGGNAATGYTKPDMNFYFQILKVDY